VSTIDKAGDVLSALSAAPNGATLGLLETATGIPKPTLYRTLRSLADHDMAWQDTAGLYRPGNRLFVLAARVYARCGVDDATRPVLLELASRVHLAVHLSIFRGNQLVYIDKLEPDTPFQMKSRVGQLQAIHSSAIGKCVLAHLSVERARDVLSAHPLEQFTPYTVTDVEEILRRLSSIRDIGYAIDDKEDQSSTRAIAVPILRSDGTPFGGISIVGPTFEASAAGLREFTSDLVKAARRLEEMLPTE
jgi:DNA-binding IclR family transcriptional regulator